MLTLLIGTLAFAALPEDPSLTAMTERDGLPVVDRAVLQADYRQLVAELGTTVANQAILPAATTGTYGFEFSLGSSFVLLDAADRERDISPWDRASQDESAAPFLYVPTFTARKGLPLSTEIGASVGWIGQTQSGVASGFARVAPLEGYQPLPDLTIHGGYSGYIGNPELQLGVIDVGVTLGTKVPVGALPKLNTGNFEPYADFSVLRIRAVPTADAETIDIIDAVGFRRNDPDSEDPIVIPRVAAGFQVTSARAHFRFAVSWSWETLPVLSSGLGFTF